VPCLNWPGKEQEKKKDVFWEKSKLFRTQDAKLLKVLAGLIYYEVFWWSLKTFAFYFCSVLFHYADSFSTCLEHKSDTPCKVKVKQSLYSQVVV